MIPETQNPAAGFGCRIFLAIGVYFGYYFITQILSTVFLITMSVITYQNWFAEMIESVVVFIGDHPYVSGHLFFLIMLVGVAIMGALYYFITHSIMKKKLNLE